MPPRHAYWTILVDEQPTAFRAALLEDLQPTFKRLKEKHPSARVVWFQNGKVWNSRLDAQEAMRERGERGRAGDFRQRQQERRGGKLDWKPRSAEPKSNWQPRDQKFAAEGRESRRSAKREGGKLEWKPKGAPGAPTPRPSSPQAPRPASPRAFKPSSPKRGDKTWRPGGEHRDPRQKYKDAKKAKWTRFKQTIRKRWEGKQPRKKDEE